MAELLARWCDEAWQVRAWVIINRVLILIFSVLFLILCRCAYHVTNILEMLIV
jgi:hypothetical protein